MTPCGHHEPDAPSHTCVGDPGHVSAWHWCLFGHIWTSENEGEGA